MGLAAKALVPFRLRLPKVELGEEVPEAAKALDREGMVVGLRRKRIAGLPQCGRGAEDRRMPFGSGPHSSSRWK